MGDGRYQGFGFIRRERQIEGLWSTGQRFALNTQDKDWKLTPPSGTPTYPYVAQNSEVFGTWDTTNYGNAKWLTPEQNGAAFVAAGTYDYELDFYLDSSCDPSTAIVVFIAESDNESTIYLNGIFQAGPGLQFVAWSERIAISGSFVSGKNTLKFSVSNTGSDPSGLRVLFLDSWVERFRKSKYIFHKASSLSGLIFGCNT